MGDLEQHIGLAIGQNKKKIGPKIYLLLWKYKWKSEHVLFNQQALGMNGSSHTYYQREPESITPSHQAEASCKMGETGSTS